MSRMRITVAIVSIAFLLTACSSQPNPPMATPLAQVDAPTSPETSHTVPGAAPNFQEQPREAFNLANAVRDPEFVKATLKWGRGIQLNQGGTLWLSVLVTLLVAFNFQKLRSRRNLDLLLLLLPAFFLVDLVALGNTPESASQESLFGLLYLGLFVSTVLLFVRVLYRGFTSGDEPFTPNLPKKLLAGLTIFLLVMNIFQALARNPDDAGAYTNVGAYHLLQTGKFPYGDPELRGGAAATYGPVLYAAHIPYQIILQPVVNSLGNTPDSILRRIIVGTDDPNFEGPPILATKLVMVTFLILVVLGLYKIGTQYVGIEAGWALACLFVGSAYVQGMGGERWYITGVTYVSHIAPAAITIWAFAVIKRPWLAGIILALGAGALYYPIFFFPLWAGYYFWRKEKWLEFSASFILVCALIFGLVLLMTQGSSTASAFQMIYESTVGHQEAGNAYGASTFSFWSTQPGITALWQKLLIPGLYLVRPSVIFFGLFLLASFFFARNRTVSQFAFLIAATAIAVQLWKSHAGGSYVEWYYPFYVIGLAAVGVLQTRESTVRQVERSAREAEPSLQST